MPCVMRSIPDDLWLITRSPRVGGMAAASAAVAPRALRRRASPEQTTSQRSPPAADPAVPRPLLLTRSLASPLVRRPTGQRLAAVNSGRISCYPKYDPV